MGEAKRRGDFEARRAAAIERRKVEAAEQERTRAARPVAVIGGGRPTAVRLAVMALLASRGGR